MRAAKSENRSCRLKRLKLEHNSIGKRQMKDIAKLLASMKIEQANQRQDDKVQQLPASPSAPTRGPRQDVPPFSMMLRLSMM